MNVREIREKSNEELFDLRFKRATGQIENPMRIRELRKSIARIKTVLTERANKED